MRLLDKREKRQQKKRGLWKFVPLLHAALFGALVLFVILLYEKIWLSAPRLKYFFIPAVFAYYCLLAAIGYWFCTRVDRLKERELMGDEWFFHTYPIEAWLNRWNKWYRSWSLSQVKELRQKRIEKERGRYWRPVERSARAEEPGRPAYLRGPELDDRSALRVYADRRREARREAEREKYKKELEAKIARELSKKGPDLPDSGFERWYETNPDQRQIIR